MKIMILGSTGMAGSMLCRYLSQTHDIVPISRSNGYDLSSSCGFDKLYNRILNEMPDVVVNCIGLLIKESNDNWNKAFIINAELPRMLAEVCFMKSIKFIHISTDCVFDGSAGPYNEDDLATERNNYGRTKRTGEITTYPHLTLRTSIIGPDPDPNGSGLFNWITKQTGTVNGFTNHMWNGITTLELARQIDRIVCSRKGLHGLYHLTTDVHVSKYELLHYIESIFNLPVKVLSYTHTTPSNKCLTNTRKGEYDPNIPHLWEQLVTLHHFIT